MATKTKELAAVLDDKELALLNADFPIEAGFTRIMPPRLGMISQDIMEGKGKNKTVQTAAGTFFTEAESEEEDEDGKKVWEKKFLDDEKIEGIILFQRKQLRLYDEATEQYTSSPIYDNDDEVVPLFCDKKEIERGTPAELKALYQYKDESTGKTKSKLEDNRILYVLFGEGEGRKVFQMNLRGSSMYNYMTYARNLTKKALTPRAVVTTFGSEEREAGTNNWNAMTFASKGSVTKADLAQVLELSGEIKKSIAEEKAFYAAKDGSAKKGQSKADKAFAEGRTSGNDDDEEEKEF